MKLIKSVKNFLLKKKYLQGNTIYNARSLDLVHNARLLQFAHHAHHVPL